MTATASLSIGDRDGMAGGLRASLDRLRYRAQHYGLTLSLGVPGRLLSMALSPSQRLDPAIFALLQQRYDTLLERDLDNVARGYYPRDLLYQFPLFDYLRRVPEAIVDVPRFMLRRYRRGYDDLPEGLDRGRYPRYYLRTFHWQTDGWFSERSVSRSCSAAQPTSCGAWRFRRWSTPCAASRGRASSTSPVAPDGSCSSCTAPCRMRSSSGST
jgi:hypothetical protein